MKQLLPPALRGRTRRSPWVLFSVAAVALSIPAWAVALTHSGGSEGIDLSLLPELAGAKQVVSYDASWGRTYQIWTASARGGRSCEIYQEGDSSAPPQSVDLNSEIVCATGLIERRAIRLGLRWIPGKGAAFRTLVVGQIDPSVVKQAAIESTDSSATSIAVGDDGYFIAELPASPARYQLAAGDPRPSVVGYDDNGSERARVKLDEFVRRAPPAG